MPDIVDLLDATARTTSAAPDLVWLEQRARQLHVRDRALQVGSLAAVVLTVALLALLPDGRDELQQLPATQPTATAEPPASPQGSSAPSPDAASAAPAPAPEGGNLPTRASDGGASAGSGAPERSTAASPAGAAYPAAASCHVSTRDVQGGPTWICRFTATKFGGWSLTRGVGVFAGYDPATVRVTVERRGTTVYSSDRDEASCANGVIKPGDRVVVSIEAHSASNVEDLDVGAGAGYSC